MSPRRIRFSLLCAGLVLPAASTAAPTPPALRVTDVQAPTAVVARQGHAQFLVGLKIGGEARVIVRTLAADTGRVVRTTKTPAAHAAGRVWLLIEANNTLGFQLKSGKYRLQIYAVDATKQRSNVITRRFTLTLRSPRGVVQAYTVPAWPSIVGGVAPAPGGQIVAAVPPGSTLGQAGLRRGDVIRSVNGVAVDTRGAWFAMQRQLPANNPVPLEYDRAGVRASLQFTPPPDWTAAPNFEALLTESVQASPGVRAFQYARARERLEAGQGQTANTLYSAWSAAEKASAPGELLAAALASADKQYVTAANAYTRALTADPTMAAAQFGLGVARSDNQQNDRAIAAFEAARTLDPADALAATFHAYALLVADQFEPALNAADAAIAVDGRYDEAYLARGLALISLGRVPEGVASLKRGLALSANPARAQQLITSYLEPNTP